MSPAAIVEAVTRHGVELRVVERDRVQCRPVERLPDDLRVTLREHRAEVAAYLRHRALRTDPIDCGCAWCRRPLNHDRQRLCRSCTDYPDAEPAPAASSERERNRKPWTPPGAVGAPRQCIRCRSGLAKTDPDNGACGACRYYFEAIMPARPQ